MRNSNSPLNLHLMMSCRDENTSGFCTRASSNICSLLLLPRPLRVLSKTQALGYRRHRAIGVVTRCPRTHGACREISISLLRAPKRCLASSRRSRSLHACRLVQLTRDRRRKLSALIAVFFKPKRARVTNDRFSS